MPDPYQGLFLRHYMNQLPDGRTTSQAWTDSPDIILNGTAPAPDPTIFTTRDSYAREQAQGVAPRELNYVYVRGLNTTAGKLDARLWLYWAVSNAVLWPQDWYQTGIYIDDPENPRNWIEITGLDPGAIGVSTPVFHWRASDGPGGGNHFCMIAFAENPPLSNPPRSPKPTGYMGTWNQLGAFVQAHPNMAWRNTITVAGLGATWTRTEPITGAEEGGEFQVGLKFKDMPTDGWVSFNVPGYDAGSSVVMPDPPEQKFRIPKSNGSMLVSIDWRKGYRSSITVNYWQGATVPPQGANITPVIAVMAEALEGLVEDPYHRSVELERYSSADANASVSAERMHIVGSVPFQW